MSFDLLNGFSLDALKEMPVLKVKPVISSFSNKKYYIVNYDKKKLTPDLYSSVGVARSIILNESGNIVCFSPPKAMRTIDFIKMYPDLNASFGEGKKKEIITEEFVEGTMINLFWDGDAWEMATKQNVGVNSAFYKGPKGDKKTFRTMFMDTGIDLNQLDKSICYSFVLQHPNNRIVVQYIQPMLTLVDAYSIDVEKKQVRSIFYGNGNGNGNVCNDVAQPLFCKFPIRYDNTSYTDLITTFASMNTPYYITGVVFRNIRTGERTKVRNPVYEEVKNLRGEHVKSQYQYLCLRQEGKIAEYLKYFPEKKSDFSQFRDKMHMYTISLYENYISCYIKKEKMLGEFPPHFRKHMFELHRMYMETLREKKQHISKMVVVDYMNLLHPSIVMHTLNYVVKQKENDVAQCENMM